MATKSKLDADLSENPVDQTEYHSKIGSLMYLTSSRPNIVQAVCFCSRYQSRPTEKHLKVVKRIFRYLRGIVNMGLWYPKGSSFDLIAFLDADHVGCIDYRKITSEGIQFLGDKLVCWMSKKQNYTAMSSAEAEYVALSASYAQVMWMRTQLQDYGFNYKKIPLYYDSQYDGDECDKGRMPTKIELTLEQSQHRFSDDVLEVLAVMFENDNEHDFNRVIDMHTKLNDFGTRISQRAELILDVKKQGYSTEVFETVKLLKDLQETDNVKPSLIWWNKNLEIIPRGLAWSRKQLFKRSDYSLLFGKVNLDLTPTISEQQAFWYMAFHKFYMSYIPRDKVKDGVIAKFNSRVFKLEAIIKVLGRERKGVSLDKSCVAEFFNNFSSSCWEELNEEFNELYETKIYVNGPAMIDLAPVEDLVWLKQEEEEMYRLDEHKMMKALFLKTLQEEDLSRYNRATDRVHLTDTFDIVLNRQGPLRCRFPWCKDVSVDRRFWESLVCLDPTKKGWIMDEHIELWVNYMWHFRPHDADWAMVGAYFV
nr:uncharacterized mitochondrial protein AtMg00810-like [Tanacetum cinerariifolium]